jgi:LysR family glycine cleavage system transcriptional activator
MSRRLPSLNALKSFEATARLGRMTAAADELCVTHGAISRQVRSLQQELGVALFDPGVQPLRLSPAGQALLPVLTQSLDQIATAVAALKAHAPQTLDVSCLSTFAMRWLIPRLHRFHERHAHLEVRLSTTSHAVKIERERYDVAINVDDPRQAAAPRDDPAVVAVTPLFDEQLGLVLSPALAATLVRPGRGRPALALAQCPRLHTRTRPSAWDDWARAVQARPARAPRREFPHYTYTLEAALGGLGLCVAPWHLVVDDVTAGRLMAPLGFAPSGLRYTAQHRPDGRPQVAALCEWLRREAQDMPCPPLADSPFPGLA